MATTGPEPSAREFLPPELQTLGEDHLRLWSDSAERHAALEAILQAWLASAPELGAMVEHVDSAVTAGLAALALPRGSVREVRIEAAYRGWHGIKHPDCTIVLDGSAMHDCIMRLKRPDTVWRVWVHESLHARQSYTVDAVREYRAFPGYEEGLVEGLARWITRDLARMDPLAFSFTYYVEAYRALAAVLGVPEQRLSRALWAHPMGAVRSALVNAVDAFRQDQGLPALSGSQRFALQAIADRLFGSDKRRDVPDSSVLRQLWGTVLR